MPAWDAGANANAAAAVEAIAASTPALTTTTTGADALQNEALRIAGFSGRHSATTKDVALAKRMLLIRQ